MIRFNRVLRQIENHGHHIFRHRDRISLGRMYDSDSLFLGILGGDSIQSNTMHTDDLQVRCSINQFFLHRGHAGDNSINIADHFLYIAHEIGLRPHQIEAVLLELVHTAGADLIGHQNFGSRHFFLYPFLLSALQSEAFRSAAQQSLK